MMKKIIFSISVIKGLVLDAIRKANSGHPGGPLSCADFTFLLYRDYLNFNPKKLINGSIETGLFCQVVTCQ